MKKNLIIITTLILILGLTVPIAWAGGNSRNGAIGAGADRVVAQQRTDTGWEGTWYWYEGSTGNATNLTGVTALGLLEAYWDTKDQS